MFCLSFFYERGSFDTKSINSLSSVLPWYLFAAVFISGLNLLRTFFYSRGEFKNLAILGLIIPMIFFVLAGVLKEEFSFVGIGIAYAVSLAILFFITVFLAQNKEVDFLAGGFLFFFLKNALNVLIVSLFITLALPLISNITSSLVLMASCLFLFLIAYILLSKFVFKLKEIEEIKLILMSKLKISNKS